ncbi:DinB family protein [Chitinophaga niastensis]|uniref:DinB family protein n=1 Tax=Chitinophaga niastensis TaxID=536980 RepID=A0A2P8HNV7_CHINA|nr:DinB family protein [Chitinophaga niastensis]PSL47904.1 DinB family protein [Chitinophaga niastensis]
MINALKESLWKQFGASIDTLKNAIILWPEEYWNTNKKFFYNAYHCLIFLDYYLTVPPKNFSSPLPFTIAAPDDVIDDAIGDVIPDSIYSKKELLDYLQLSREKCHKLIAGLTEEKLKERWIEEPGTMNYSVLEILLYNMRHVQHHAAQLNFILRQEINNAPGWISQAEDDL